MPTNYDRTTVHHPRRNSNPYVIHIGHTRGAIFEAWRKLRWGTIDLANPAMSGESADAEGDGIPNLAEYAHGGEPIRADAARSRSA